MIAHHIMTWNGWAKQQGTTVDLPTVLAELKQAGYDAIEMGGTAAMHGSAAALQALLRDHGIAAAAWSSGVAANPWPANIEQYQREFAFAAEMGVRTIVVCGGFLDGRRTAYDADYRLFAESLNAAITCAARNGQTLAFHPHKGCLVETLAEIDRLLRFCPELRLCIDVGHLAAVFEDPLLALDAHADRVVALHLKDFDRVSNRFMELGRGQVDLAAVVAWIRRRSFAGPLIVERDAPPMPALESAMMSLAHWRQLTAG
jgi:inosose dehydratase